MIFSLEIMNKEIMNETNILSTFSLEFIYEDLRFHHFFIFFFVLENLR